MLLATVLLWLTYPLIVKAFETPQEYVPQASADTVLDAQALSWEQIKNDPRFIEHLVAYSFPDAPVMVDIARAESHFNPSAKNPNSTATGVFQILIGTWEDHDCVGSRVDAIDNISCARKIYERSGTGPWNASIDKWGAS